MVFFFFFLYKWKENPGEAAPPSPQSVMHYRCFSFLVTVFVFGPGTTPQILLVLTQGVFASPPFTCIRKKKNDGLKNVLRKIGRAHV